MADRLGRVAIIGGGYAGMAAAVELATAGRPVDVFEASRTLGGRARATRLDDVSVDNGQHILIGAYADTLRLMRVVGADPDALLWRMPLALDFPGEFRLVAPRLPAPFHAAAALLGARGLPWAEKFAAVRLMRGLQAANYRIEPDLTVAAWLDARQVPSRQRRLLWEPLCIAALNTSVADASAQVLARVLRDSLGGAREASDLLLPRVDLSALFPEPAALHVGALGGAIHRGHRVASLSHTGGAWHIDDAGRYASVIVAVAPQHLAGLVPELAVDAAALRWEPIVTAYLRYPDHVRLPRPMLGIADGLAQWVFDRGALTGPTGLLAAVISARGRHLDLADDDFFARLQAEIGKLVPGLPPPLWQRRITEKRATFSCTPELRRPALAAGPPGLLLAGDYVAGDYPATLEGAVRSGVAAARRLLHQSPARQP